MSFYNSFHKNLSPLSHLPTWFFIIGYPIFWLELSVLHVKGGKTSFLAWVLFGLVAFFLLSESTKKINPWVNNLLEFWNLLDIFEKFLLSIGFILCSAIITIITLASFLPIHLLQEFDCLQYHYTLPHQHLILGSFAHIPWSADDLFLLPIDFALSPFWFFTYFPNKIPQLIVSLGLIAIVVRLALAGTKFDPFWVGAGIIFVLLGSHGLGIQMGTAMLEITIAYLFFACLDSLRTGRWLLAAIEGSFFFWSKPLMPLQVLIVLLILFVVLRMLAFFKYKIISEFSITNWRKFLLSFVVLSLFIGGPFVLKSIDNAATPFFPLAPGIMGTTAKIQTNPQAWSSLQQASHICMVNIKDGYGHGRDFWAFLKHWWLLAIPEQGVNNAFDYPLGLPYLLLIVPFIVFFFNDLIVRKVYSLSLLAIIGWGLWWFSVQQSRFLYIPLIIIFIITLSRYVKLSKILLACLLISLFFNFISLCGAHRQDLFRPVTEVIRSEDRRLINMTYEYYQNNNGGYLDYPKHTLAYAGFPVRVNQEALPHVIKF